MKVLVQVLVLVGCSSTPRPAAAPPVPQPPAPQARWRPTPGTRWQIQLSGAFDPTAEAAVYELDLFDTPPAAVAALHKRGRHVICYFSAGTHEDWRPDASQFPSESFGRPLPEWRGEKWLDVRAPRVRELMAARLDRAARTGCDGVDPDNVDAHANKSGFWISARNQLAYNRFLAAEAHARGLAVALKNDLEQAEALAPDFDFAVVEQCFAHAECDAVIPFTRAGKAVWAIEYGDGAPAAPLCRHAHERHIDLLYKKLQLDAARGECP
jgi:hypothetical protein